MSILGKGQDSDPIRVPLASLAPDPHNPRKMNDEARAGLGVSMETFGELGMVFNDRTGQMVSGHQRLERLRAAGAVEVVRTGAEGYVVHPKTGERFRVRFVDWDETKQRMANLVANNPHISGDFTEDALAQLKELEDVEGFAELELDALEAELAELSEGDEEAKGGECDPDDVPDAPEEPFSKRGDLWLLGDHRLLCGDSTSAEDVARLMDNNKAAMCCSDPPYGVNFQDAEGKNIAADIGYSVIPGFFGIACDVLAPGRAILLFGAETNVGLYVALFGRELKMRPRLLFWKKKNFILRHHDYHSQYEAIFYGWKPGGDAGTRWHGDRKQSDVWDVGHDSESSGGSADRLHPTQKPVELFSIPMRNHTRSGEVVYEPFSGSGSQLIAAEQLGRRCYAMELEPRYVDVAVARWEKFTGKKGVRADG